ncbi:hypothetical protein OS187_01960 [Xanthomonadaceae bacterium JHOS43]|nr:hypothetical protein [Xanthomonadaceae bacterium JHOS43]MCX7563730.1 hypothetical protein [Xanthomonadaceae bacterium XH05]
MSVDPSLVAALLAQLAEAPEGLSLPRLCKRLDVRMSVLTRTLSWIGEASIAGQPGPGWVRLEEDRRRTLVHLAPAGEQLLRERG